MPHAQNLGIGGHEPAEAGRIVPSAEVVKAKFGIPFFAGEFVFASRKRRRMTSFGSMLSVCP
jgi:hypothetical protein